MKWLFVLLASLYVLEMLRVALKAKYFPPKCPKCLSGNLKLINSIIESYPAKKGITGKFYICLKCRERFFWSTDLKCYKNASDSKYDHWYKKK